jgi:hypothetical protein
MMVKILYACIWLSVSFLVYQGAVPRSEKVKLRSVREMYQVRYIARNQVVEIFQESSMLGGRLGVLDRSSCFFSNSPPVNALY